QGPVPERDRGDPLGGSGRRLRHPHPDDGRLRRAGREEAGRLLRAQAALLRRLPLAHRVSRMPTAAQRKGPTPAQLEKEKEQRKYRRARRKAREAAGEIKELNIVAMMDMMTILLVFLLK